MKKIISLLLVLLMTFSIMTPVSAASNPMSSIEMKSYNKKRETRPYFNIPVLPKIPNISGSVKAPKINITFSEDFFSNIKITIK